jgi:hypothetical protein
MSNADMGAPLPAQQITRGLLARITSNIVNLLAWLVVLAIVILIIATPFWTFILIWAWPRLRGTMDLLWVRILMMVAAALTGGGLYLMRRKFQRYYGIGEICVGMAVCWGIISQAPASGLAASFGLAGGVYIIVRGLDNLLGEQKSQIVNAK